MQMARIWVVWVVWATMVAAVLPGTRGCVEKERIGVMELRKSMNPHNLTRLPSDCCLLDGVNCDATTGRVHQLDLCSLWSYDLLPVIENRVLNVSLLLPFDELLELTLDSCHTSGLINQADLIKLTRLETLKIYHNDLSDVSLKGFCQMKNIKELRLGSNNITGHLPLCIGNLTQLQVLDLRYNRIIGNIPSIIGNFAHLSSLFLSGNFWSSPFSLHLLANNSKLENLLLSGSGTNFSIETETQSWFPSFQLKYLDLRYCNLNKMSSSVIPTFLLHQFQLNHIDLSDNNLQDTFPSWLLQNNSKLKNFWMSNNSLTGNLVLLNFIHGFLRSLVVDNNKIGGKFPGNLQVFLPALESLQISKNIFEGNLPSSLGKKLEYVDLSFNSFSGRLPNTLFANNDALLTVDLSNNVLHSEISLNLTTLRSLSDLFLSNNKFNESIEVLSPQSSSLLQIFDVSNNLISSKLSNLISNFSYLEALIASNNSFKGGIPDKLCHISNLIYLDISHNDLSGLIPSCLINSSIRFLYMRNVGLSGAMPNGLFNTSMLVALDLSYNAFSQSTLPNWIYFQHQLQILLMAGLGLEGLISTHLCELQNITIMDLSHNKFSGSIPSCLFKIPFRVSRSPNAYADAMDFTYSFYITTFAEVEFTTKGRSIIFKRSMLGLMNGLDVSSNKLSGQIPLQIGDAEAIHSLNLSNNRLWGSIPTSISRLRDIESLDLSSNNLSGEIPSEIVRLNFLSTFNVSNNNLSGSIPNGGQFSNFDERNYGGNEFLCGPLLHKHCITSSSHSTTPPDEQEDNGDETIFERTSFWWSFIIAYVVVFISVVIVVGIDTRLSKIWFRNVDVVCSKLCGVFVKLKFISGMK